MQFGGGLMKDEYSSGKEEWSKKFWDECKAKTECYAPEPESVRIEYDLAKTVATIRETWSDLSIHFATTDKFTHVQPRRDASFGFCFYALAITQEGLASSGKLLTAKLALRMLAEIYITFCYLILLHNCIWQVKIACGKIESHS